MKSGTKILLAAYPAFVFITTSIWSSKNISDIKQTRFSVVANIGIEEARSESDRPYQFSSILSADCDAEGNIYILDYKDACVRVFDKNGKYLRIILGPGQGPNEIENPYRIKIHRARKRVLVLHKNGFQIKEFDDLGNFVRSHSLPEQMYGYYDFVSENCLLFIASRKYGEKEFNNFKIFNLETQRIEREFAPTMSDYFTSFQRFLVKDGIVWTCPGGVMELEAYDLKTGVKRNAISLPEKHIPVQVLKWQRNEQGIQKLRLSNYAQPFLLGQQLYVIVTRQQFGQEPPNSPNMLDRPLKRAIKVYQLENERLIEVPGFPFFGFYDDFLTSWQNRIVISSSFYDAFPQIIILEIHSGG
jgi:hypothetical protein